MADEVFYTMGQIRYRTNSEYVHEYPVIPLSVQISQESTYRDIAIVPYVENPTAGSGSSFVYQSNTPYYLRLAIPKNAAYAMTLTIKLCNTNLTGSGSGYESDTLDGFNYNKGQYQIIKRILVPQAILTGDSYNRVVLYPDPDDEDEVKVVIAREYNTGNESLDRNEWVDFNSIVGRYSLAVGDIVYNAGTQEYYFIKDINQDPAKDSNGSYNVTTNPNIVSKRNDAILTHIWKQSETEDKAIFEMVFSSRYDQGHFNTILLELLRRDWDQDIHYTIDGLDDMTFSGLKIEPEDVEVYVGEIVNLLGESTIGANETNISSIGIWGHPNLITTINGEEIRVGQSGYYELNDFDINYFGVVALSSKDKFTADYQTVIQTEDPTTLSGTGL